MIITKTLCSPDSRQLLNPCRAAEFLVSFPIQFTVSAFLSYSLPRLKDRIICYVRMYQGVAGRKQCCVLHRVATNLQRRVLNNPTSMGLVFSSHFYCCHLRPFMKDLYGYKLTILHFRGCSPVLLGKIGY